MNLAKMDAFSGILGQPKVRDFLRRSVEGNHVSQSYIFLGPTGSNKTQAAYALACAFICGNSQVMGGQCGKCDNCKKILAHKHQDVKYYAPEGQNAYLISQIREIIHDTELAPVQGDRKVYIIDRADLLGVGPANAFLKTLEDPIPNTCMILLGRSSSSVLPTILSRCVCVPFRQIPPDEAVGIISQNAGVDEQKSRVALASSGYSISSAIKMLRSFDNSMLYLRKQIVEFVLSCANSTNWDILKTAKEILALIKAPTDDYKRQLEEEIAKSEEFLSSAAKKALEVSNKRGLKRQEIKMINFVLNIEVSLLCDILHATDFINFDYADQLDVFANHAKQTSIVNAIDAVRNLQASIAYNVSVESIVDLALFEFKGAV